MHVTTTCLGGIKVGSLVYATEQGLGILAKQFYDAGFISHVEVIHHRARRNHTHSWYPGAHELYTRQAEWIGYARRLCEAVDIMLFFETPFDWQMIEYCKQVGTKTVLMPMHECMPQQLPAVPDVMLCPSILETDLYAYLEETTECRVVQLTVPIPTTVYNGARMRSQARVFVHNAGHGGLMGRNGTGLLLDALQFVTSQDFKLILRTQDKLPWSVPADKRLDLRVGTVPYSELFTEGDVFLFPEKFNGLSMPINEAFASGMVVAASNRPPNNRFLPSPPLIKVEEYKLNQIGSRFATFAQAVITPQEIANTINRLMDPNQTPQKAIEGYSCAGIKYGWDNCWGNTLVVEQYARLFKSLIHHPKDQRP